LPFLPRRYLGEGVGREEKKTSALYTTEKYALRRNGAHKVIPCAKRNDGLQGARTEGRREVYQTLRGCKADIYWVEEKPDLKVPRFWGGIHVDRRKMKKIRKDQKLLYARGAIIRKTRVVAGRKGQLSREGESLPRRDVL